LGALVAADRSSGAPGEARRQRASMPGTLAARLPCVKEYVRIMHKYWSIDATNWPIDDLCLRKCAENAEIS
jgi:hypothetical protein